MLVSPACFYGREPEIQRAGDVNPRRVGIVRKFIARYLMARAETADSRYPACQDAAEATKIFHYGNALPRGSRHPFSREDAFIGIYKAINLITCPFKYCLRWCRLRMAIILIRGLDVLMIMNTLGMRGMGEVYSSQRADVGNLPCLSGKRCWSLLVLCVFAGEGRSWALGVLTTQIV